MDMNTLKKIVCHPSVALNILTTGFLVVEIYLQNPLTIHNVIIRYIGVVLVGFLWEKGLRLLMSLFGKIKPKKSGVNIVQWLWVAFFYGAFMFGLTTGTFFFLFMLFATGWFAHIPVILPLVVYGYGLFLVGGFCWGSIMYIILSIRKLRRLKKEA